MYDFEDRRRDEMKVFSSLSLKQIRKVENEMRTVTSNECHFIWKRIYFHLRLKFIPKVAFKLVRDSHFISKRRRKKLKRNLPKYDSLPMWLPNHWQCQVLQDFHRPIDIQISYS